MTDTSKPGTGLIKTLETLTDALYAQGDIFDLGCSESEIDKMLQQAHAIFPGKKRRIVTEWQWWDIQIPAPSKLPEKYQPVILYASNVLHDESSILRKGDWARSTFLLRVHLNCIFETNNSFYIMVGKGTRKSVDIETVNMIF